MSSAPLTRGDDVNATGPALMRLRVLVFGVATAVALVTVFLIWRNQSVVAQTNDIYKFADLGRNIAEGHGLQFTGGSPTIRRAPLYPAFIALLYLIFGVHPLVIQVAQCLLAAGTCLLAFEIGRKLFSLRTGLIAAAIASVHPMIMRYAPDIQVETLLTFLYTLTVYRTVRLVEDGTALNGFLLGLAAAAAAMVKSVALPYAALFALTYLVFRRVERRRMTGGPRVPGFVPIVAMMCAMGLVILPWTYRNYQITGTFVPVSGNASGEFLRGYVFAQPRYFLLKDPPYTVGEQEANEMQRKLFRDKGLVWERDETETEHVQSLAMKEKLRASPADFVKKVTVAAFMFWYVVTSRANSLLVGGLALAAWALAFYGMKHGKGRGHVFWLLLLPVLSLNLIYALVLALGRYSAPCIPSLVVLAAFGADRLLQKFTSIGHTPSPS
jgi:4-amino-4-deoxy-L-arabinose transferase-like glycosyltransferase